MAFGSIYGPYFPQILCRAVPFLSRGVTTSSILLGWRWTMPSSANRRWQRTTSRGREGEEGVPHRYGYLGCTASFPCGLTEFVLLEGALKEWLTDLAPSINTTAVAGCAWVPNVSLANIAIDIAVNSGGLPFILRRQQHRTMQKMTHEDEGGHTRGYQDHSTHFAR